VTAVLFQKKQYMRLLSSEVPLTAQDHGEVIRRMEPDEVEAGRRDNP
jgi:hypothetical protein